MYTNYGTCMRQNNNKRHSDQQQQWQNPQQDPNVPRLEHNMGTKNVNMSQSKLGS